MPPGRFDRTIDATAYDSVDARDDHLGHEETRHDAPLPTDKEIPAESANAEQDYHMQLSSQALKTSHLRLLIVATCLLVLGFFFIGVPYMRSQAVADLRTYGTVVQVGKHWHGFNKIEGYFPFGDSYTNNVLPVMSNHSTGPATMHFRSWRRIIASEGDIPLDTRVTQYPTYLSEHLNHSKIWVHNMAVAGTTIDDHVTPGYISVDFSRNVERFLETYCTNNTGRFVPRGWSADNTLFSVLYGINDLCANTVSAAALQATFQTYDRALHTLYLAGARNFMLINLPPIDLSPPLEGTERSVTGDSVRLYNKQIELSMQRLRHSHSDVTMFSLDVNRLIRQVIQNPDSFQATKNVHDTTHYCPTYAYLYLNGSTVATAEQVASCGGILPTEYLWHDHLHLESAPHLVIAEAAQKLTLALKKESSSVHKPVVEGSCSMLDQSRHPGKPSLRGRQVLHRQPVAASLPTQVLLVATMLRLQQHTRASNRRMKTARSYVPPHIARGASSGRAPQPTPLPRPEPCELD